MWYIRKYRPSNTYILLCFLILISICLYITFYGRKFSRRFKIEFSNASNSSHEYFHVQFDSATNTAICQPNDYLIIYILSTIKNIERRKVIRSTWASKQTGVCFIFILGEVSGLTLNAGRVQMDVNNERKEYKDIVQIDHMESYANVVFKEVAALQWSHDFYPNIPYLFKTDDDLIVDTLLIASIIRVLVRNTSDDSNWFISKHRSPLISHLISSDRTRFFRSAWHSASQPTVRDGGKFDVSREVWPHDFLPAYCSGFGWIMSNYIRDKLVNASHTYPLKKVAWIGDVFASGFLAKAANVKCTGIVIDYEQTASANCSCLMVNNPMLTVCSSSIHAGGGVFGETNKYNEYYRAWKVIQLRHNSTNMTINEC